MKKKLLTSYIENQKFVINNKVSANNKNFPFTKTSHRFVDTYKKDEINGTLAVRNRKAMKASLSSQDLTRNTGVAKFTLHKNKSQPVFDLSKVVNI